MNVLTLTGRIGDEPVRRDTTKGVVCEFRLAVDGRPRLWIVVETWGHLAGAAPNICTPVAGRRHRQLAARPVRDQIRREGRAVVRKAHDVTFLDKPIDETK